MGASEILIDTISNFEAKISMKKVDISVINSLRRIMINEIPTMAIDLVFVEINSSLIHDEFLAHRLGLIPLFSDEIDEFRYTRECECEKFCSKCSVAYSLDVISNEKNKTVLSTDLVPLDSNQNLYPKNVIPVHNSSLSGFSNSESILLAKLSRGQRIKLIGIAKKGTGIEHAKWSPVSIIKIKKQPLFSINIEQINCLFDHDSKKELEKNFPHIFKYDYSNETLVFHGIYENGRSFFSVNFMKKFIEFVITKKIETKKVIKIDGNNSNFEMFIETTGAKKAEIVFKNSINILKKKLNTIGIHIEKFF